MHRDEESTALPQRREDSRDEVLVTAAEDLVRSHHAVTVRLSNTICEKSTGRVSA
jgi:hypothetical protein